MKSVAILSQRFVLTLLLIQLKVVAIGQGELTKMNFISPQNNGITTGESEVVFSVSKLSNLCFGAFYPGKFGGSVVINEEGVRSSNGSVILLNSELQPSPAVFEIRCESNTMINVIVEETIVMQSANNGTVTCEIIDNGKSNFISPENAENGFLYTVGGRITTSEIQNSITEEYTGTVSITVIFE